VSSFAADATNKRTAAMVSSPGMRVGLWVDNIADPQQSGMGYHQRGLLEALDRRPNDNEYVAFFTPRHCGQRLEDLNLQHVGIRSLPAIRHVWYPLWDVARRPNVDRMLPPLDLIHLVHASVTVPTRKPKVVTVVDLASFHLPAMYPMRRRLLKHRALQRSAADERCLFITSSEYVKRDFCERYAVSPIRVHVAPLGVDRSRFKTDISECVLERVCKRYGLDRDYFLFVGLLSPRKNVDLLVEAYRRLREHHHDAPELVLAGGRGWLHDAVTRQAMATRGVRTVGYVDSDDLPALYALATAFVFPSSYEGFGLPVLESMACGTPVIASNLTALPEVVGHAGLLLEELSSEVLRSAMEQLLPGTDLSERLRRAGLERVESFTWERHAELTVNAYERLAAA
jgi:glycosyltransferase involved in cell wall biosynthesis